MNQSSKRLEPVRKLTGQRERQAADKLGQAQSSVSRAKAKLEELENYRLQYLSEFQQRASRGMSASQMQYYQGFLGQLDNAINVQERQIERLIQEVANEKENWQKKSQRNQVVQKYQSKLKANEEKVSERKQARRIEDDFNMRRR